MRDVRGDVATHAPPTSTTFFLFGVRPFPSSVPCIVCHRCLALSTEAQQDGGGRWIDFNPRDIPLTNDIFPSPSFFIRLSSRSILFQHQSLSPVNQHFVLSLIMQIFVKT